jgi:hypothetical protein
MSGNIATSLVQFTQFSGLELNAHLVVEEKSARQKQKLIIQMKSLTKVFVAVLLAVSFAFSGFQGYANAEPKQKITGSAQCMVHNRVLYEYSSTICNKPTHDACTEAKILAVRTVQGQERCTRAGGHAIQSSRTCTYGPKC